MTVTCPCYYDVCNWFHRFDMNFRFRSRVPPASFHWLLISTAVVWFRTFLQAGLRGNLLACEELRAPARWNLQPPVPVDQTPTYTLVARGNSLFGGPVVTILHFRNSRGHFSVWQPWSRAPTYSCYIRLHVSILTSQTRLQLTKIRHPYWN